MKHFFHSLILLFFILIFSFFANAAENFVCHIAKVTATSTTELGVVYRGNSFAVSPSHLILNDHSLPENVKKIEVFFNDIRLRNQTAKIVARDFHTDLALIEVEGTVLTPCQFAGAGTELRKLAEVTIEGFENESASTTLQKATLINVDSRAMTVPGIVSALEFSGLRVPTVFPGSNQERVLAIKHSMSGGPVFAGTPARVYGMITQITTEGTSLAIPSRDIYSFAKNYFNGTLPRRRYQFNRDTQIFEIDGGLSLKGMDQIKKNASGGVHEGAGGTVHEGAGGTLHEGDRNPQDAIRMFMKTGGIYSPGMQNSFVSLKNLDLGYAVASVTNKNALIRQQPILVELLNRFSIKTIYIRAVDGVRVKSLFELVRVMGECRKCIIDNFYVEAEGINYKSDNILSAVMLISKLLDSFSETKKNDPQFISDMTEILDMVMIELSAYLQDIYSGQGASPGKYDNTMRSWRNAENRMMKIYISDEENDLLRDIRDIFAAQSRYLKK